MAKNMSYHVMHRKYQIKCGKENKVSNAKKKKERALCDSEYG
jgi:hypothetical protein